MHHLLKAVLILFVLHFLFCCSTKPYVVEPVNEKNDSTLIPIFIVNHGWHTGIIIPASYIQSQSPALKTRFKETPYLEFGWGDQGFYQAEEITTGITINAILWPTETVVHVVALPEDVNNYFSNVESLCITRSEYNTLTSFLLKSFAIDDDGNVIQMAKGIYGNSQFYKGTGSYHLFNTCNKWTAKGLKSAGYDISPSTKLTAESIIRYLAMLPNPNQQCQKF